MDGVGRRVRARSVASESGGETDGMPDVCAGAFLPQPLDYTMLLELGRVSVDTGMEGERMWTVCTVSVVTSIWRVWMLPGHEHRNHGTSSTPDTAIIIQQVPDEGSYEVIVDAILWLQ